jgi:outer membrane murein-binding lipoprotein Lpp
VVEILAAVAGASITVAGVSITSLSRQGQESRESLVRLATAVESLTSRLDVLHADIKSKDSEVFTRISALERSVARLEARDDHA